MTTYLAGAELRDALKTAGMEEVDAFVNETSATFDSSDEEAVSRAQAVLLDNGYVFDRADMVEGHFYLYRFRSHGSIWPYAVALRYLNRSQYTPPMVMLSSNNGIIVPLAMLRNSPLQDKPDLLNQARF